MNQEQKDHYFMEKALQEAKVAFEKDEVPVGAIIVSNDKIIATSVGAKDIIKKTKVFSNLEKSLNKTDILIATSARFRNKNVKHINLDDLKKIDFKKKIGFLFGSEASGLSNDEISYANYTLQIPTNPNFKSFSYPLRSRPIDFNGLRSINRMKSHTHNITDKNSMILRGKKKLI